MARKQFGPYVGASGKIVSGLYWVNGHLTNVSRVTAVREVCPGRYAIETRHLGTWRCEGGRKLGGGPRDWFLDEGDDSKPYIKCTSLADAIRCIETL